MLSTMEVFDTTDTNPHPESGLCLGNKKHFGLKLETKMRFWVSVNKVNMSCLMLHVTLFDKHIIFPSP